MGGVTSYELSSPSSPPILPRSCGSPPRSVQFCSDPLTPSAPPPSHQCYSPPLRCLPHPTGATPYPSGAASGSRAAARRFAVCRGCWRQSRFSLAPAKTAIPPDPDFTDGGASTQQRRSLLAPFHGVPSPHPMDPAAPPPPRPSIWRLAPPGAVAAGLPPPGGSCGFPISPSIRQLRRTNLPVRLCSSLSCCTDDSMSG